MSKNLYTYISDECPLVTIRRTTDILSIPVDSTIIDEDDVKHPKCEEMQIVAASILSSGFAGDYLYIGSDLIKESEHDVSYYVRRENFLDLFDDIGNEHVSTVSEVILSNKKKGMFYIPKAGDAVQDIRVNTSRQKFNLLRWISNLEFYLDANIDFFGDKEQEFLSTKFANLFSKEISDSIAIATDKSFNLKFDKDLLAQHIYDKLYTMISSVWPLRKENVCPSDFYTFYRFPNSNFMVYLRVSPLCSAYIPMPSITFSITDYTEEEMKSSMYERVLRKITAGVKFKSTVADVVRGDILAIIPQVQKSFKTNIYEITTDSTSSSRYRLLQDLNRLKLINTRNEIRKAHKKLEDKFKNQSGNNMVDVGKLLNSACINELGCEWSCYEVAFPYQFTDAEIAKFQIKVNKEASKQAITSSMIRKEIFRKIRTIYHLTKPTKRGN